MEPQNLQSIQSAKGEVSVRLLCIVALLLSSGCGRDADAPIAASNSESAANETPAPLDPSELLQEGLAALKAHDVDKADELARTLIAQRPSDPENIFLMAMTLAEQNRFAESIKRLEDLAQDVPSTRLPVLGQTADWMVQEGRWLDAEQRCFEILDEVPDAIPVHRLLVQLYTRQGRRTDAAKHLRLLCRLGNIDELELQALLRTFYSFSYNVDEEEYDPISDLGLAHYQISDGDWASALTTLDQLSDRNAAESALLGRILVQHQEFERLSPWAAEIPDSAKVTSDYWFAMGVHKAKQGEHVAAIKNFCATVVRDHTDQQAYLWMSASLEAINADAQATEAANRAELIELTQVIAAELSTTTQPGLQRMAELVDILNQLQRPFEALSWQAVLLAYGRSGITESQAQQMITEINENRLRLLEAGEPIPSRQFLICGITPEVLQAAENLNAVTDRDQ